MRFRLILFLPPEATGSVEANADDVAALDAAGIARGAISFRDPNDCVSRR